MKALLNKEEAAQLLKVSERTLDRMRKEGEISFIPVRGQIRFRPEAIEQFIANSEIREDR